MTRTQTLTLAALLLVPVAAGAKAQTATMPPGSAGTVTLSRTEYDRLLDLGANRPAGPATAPAAAALARADIRVRVGTTTARATMRVDGEVFRSGIAKVPLIKGATLLDARMDNRALPIVAEAEMLVAIVSGPGAFAATLETGSPLAFSPGRASFVLPVPQAGSATAAIDVPGEQADVHVANGIVLRRASANGRTTVDVALPTGRPAEVWWSTHETPAGTTVGRDVRLLSDVKSVITIGESDVRLISLLNTTVVQGEPSQFSVAIPSGYEVTSISGASLDRSEIQAGRAILYVADPAARRHQFLLSLERTHAGGSFKLETGLPAIPAAQRETGEIAIEGLGTIEIGSPEMPGLRRIDVRELDPALSSVARDAMLAAYRYQRVADEPPLVTVDVRRFANAPVLAAVAERAVATTLVTAEGRALTEVTLWLRNTAQPFMKVTLPQGASIVSVEVAGSPAKPVEGADGNRVPLLRPGFRPVDAYPVSFVYLHNGTPFLKKGDMRMTLPKMDVPVDVLEWELFVPDQFRADHFQGNVIDAALMPIRSVGYGIGAGVGSGSGGGVGGGVFTPAAAPVPAAGPGQIVGRVVDPSGAPLPGVTVVIESGRQRQTAITDASGIYSVYNVQPGPVVINGQLQGFKNHRQSLSFDGQGRQLNFMLELAAIAETVSVNAASPEIRSKDRIENQAPSVNVQNLQRRASGVLPIRIEVPRTGTSHSFVKPLVIDEEAVVAFKYKRR
ncbi:MAG TPA: carboxypeptidase-like regulatory domain-containing protein [Vicinamibacterales bacterium]|nr:carboxypeptidase-like regulatory domain-containing protein [Vicinamibacterales bacterium]